MTKIYCDKCKKETNRPIVVDLPIDKSSLISSHNIPIQYYDLCMDCFNKLKKWIDEE